MQTIGATDLQGAQKGSFGDMPAQMIAALLPAALLWLDDLVESHNAGYKSHIRKLALSCKQAEEFLRQECPQAIEQMKREGVLLMDDPVWDELSETLKEKSSGRSPVKKKR